MERIEMKALAKTRFKTQYGLAVLAVVIPIALISAASTLTYGILTIFALPILVGEAKFFLGLHTRDDVDINVLFDGFKGPVYLRNVGYMFLKNVFIFLWSLLFIIPGIIKSFSYALVPYLLADEAVDLTTKDAITKSRMMMNGYKMELFVIYLSFIGWFILSMLTFGILHILYVGPYIKQTLAIFYTKVKEANPTT